MACAARVEDSPEAREEIDRLLDPDDPVLLESDRNRTKGTLTDITRIMLRSIRAMSEAEKAEIRAHLNKVLPSKDYGQLSLTVDDKSWLHRIPVGLSMS
jgi:hypothetical protein